MNNVLIFPAGTEVGLEIERSLRDIMHFKVFGATSIDDHSQYTYPNMVERLPMFDEADFALQLSDVLKRYSIDFLFPAHDDLVTLLPKLKTQGAIPSNVKVITSPPQTTELARSKRDTYAALSNVISVPKLYDPHTVTVSDLPLFIKPDRGQGSIGARKVTSLKDLTGVSSDFVLSEFLTGPEYTIDCFTDRKGKLLFAKGRLRMRVRNGISVSSQAVDGPEFERLAKAINDTVSFRGMWFFQLKRREDGDLVLLEIAPRVSGGMGFFRAAGVNLPLLALYDQMENDVSVFFNDVPIVRDCALSAAYQFDYQFDTVYVDLDDTLIFGDKTNSDLVGLLYHWKNQRKHLVLITRHLAVHSREPRATLKQHAIAENLFSEVIDVARGHNKSTHIKSEKSIFIDDSASERLDVHTVNGIPTFTCTQACEVLSRSIGNF